jgi:MYXO-CTERM domain-containing protein
VYASSGDPGLCNNPGSGDCLTCNGVMQTCNTSTLTCTPPQYVPDAGPIPDSGTAQDAGMDGGGTVQDAGVKTCVVDSDCGAVDEVCSHASVPYVCVSVTTGDPGYCTQQSNGVNPCPVQGQMCISNVCTPRYGSDAGMDGGSTSSSSSSCGCSSPTQGGPDFGALVLALGLVGLAGMRRRRLE